MSILIYVVWKYLLFVSNEIYILSVIIITPGLFVTNLKVGCGGILNEMLV